MLPPRVNQGGVYVGLHIDGVRYKSAGPPARGTDSVWRGEAIQPELLRELKTEKLNALENDFRTGLFYQKRLLFEALFSLPQNVISHKF